MQKRAIFALLAAVIAVTGPAMSQRAFARDIQLGVVNNTKTPVAVSFCRMGDVSMAYQFSIRKNPCSTSSESQTINGNGDRKYFGANPIGVVMQVNGKTVYFYASNPAVGKPFFEINGSKVSMVEGELQTRSAGGITVRFHRGGDTQYKVMVIEILSV